MRFGTRAIHVGQHDLPYPHPVTEPIYQTSTFEWDRLDSPPEHQYTRYTNPNRSTIEGVLASLENGTQCTCFSSGMAAIVSAFSLLKSGDHLLIAKDIYGGTSVFANEYLPRQGIEVSEFDSMVQGSLTAQARANTKMAVFETPTNPNLRIADIAAITAEARKLSVTTLFDNTFASPYCQNPLDLGADIVMHSTTKYISGHSDVIGGAIITRDDAFGGPINRYARVAGGTPSPFDNWLSLRGVKTLALRMRQHCANAQAIAEFLAGHPKVAAVHYPGLPSHPDHALARRQMSAFGGMLAFELKGSAEQAKVLFEKAEIFRIAPSFGGVDSLIGYPPAMSHAAMTEAERLERGIPPTLLRLSTGIEDTEDLIEDLARVLGLSF